jgi:hypothetical protein
MTERKIQNKTVDLLRQAGYTVMVTSNKKKTSNTKGMPDIYVCLYRNHWIALDTKTPTGGLSEEQKALSEEGKVYYYTDPHEAVAYCISARAQILGVKSGRRVI